MAAGSKQLCKTLKRNVEFDIPEKSKAKVVESLAQERVLRLNEMKCQRAEAAHPFA